MKLIKQLRYLRHLPLKMIAGKLIHSCREHYLKMKPPSQSTLTLLDGPFFESEALSAFADSYQCTGDRFHTAKEIWEGTFSSRGATWNFGSVESVDWQFRFKGDGTRVNWNYDWCSFSFAIALARLDPERALQTIADFVALIDERHPVSSAQGTLLWEPIVVSLRVMSISVAANLASRTGVDSPKSMLILARHVEYCTRLLEHLKEIYLGYNHAAFGVTGIFAAKLALENQSIQFDLDEALRVFKSQILDDGYHAELSPTYHIHVLLLLRSMVRAGVIPEPYASEMSRLEEKMQSALEVTVHPDGEIALFNDAAIEDSVAPCKIGWLGHTKVESVRTLPDAGYARLNSGPFTAIFDAGQIGPRENCGHGHADFLSIELSVADVRLIVDPGVMSTSNDSLRQRTKSSESHNGPCYQGLEPVEFFGAWRVGRRGRAKFGKVPDILPVELTGFAEGYPAIGGRVARYIGVGDSQAMVIADAWVPLKSHAARVSFLLHPDWEVITCTNSSIKLLHRKQGVESLMLTILAGNIISCDRDDYYPRGPMLPEHATRITFLPDTELFSCMRISMEEVNTSIPIESIKAQLEKILTS